MLKYIFTIIVSWAVVLPVCAQVGIGTTNPVSTLEIKADNVISPSSSTGLLIPRVNNFPDSNPSVNQDGMLIFVTGAGDDPRGFYYWDLAESKWTMLLPEGSEKYTLDDAYNEGGPGAGRKINATDGVVEINGESGFEVKKSPLSETMEGYGVKMFFNPETGSFRAGEVINDGVLPIAVWDDISQGQNSFAVNESTRASGDGSFAAGRATIASGSYSAAFGEKTSAINRGEFAVGRFSTSKSARLFSVGNGSSVSSLSNAFEVFDNGGVRISDAYTLPNFDGLPNRILSTDGNGSVSWREDQNTDNQMITEFDLDNDELSISLERDAQSVHTVDLSSLKDGTGTDNQIITDFSLDSDRRVLSISIENGNTIEADFTPIFPVKARTRAVMSSDQVITGPSVSKVSFDQKDFDIGDDFDTTNKHFIAPRNGFYKVTAQYATAGAMGSNGIYELRVRIGGNVVRGVRYTHHGSGPVVRQINTLLLLSQGEQVDIMISTPQSIIIPANSSLTFFEIEEL